MRSKLSFPFGSFPMTEQHCARFVKRAIHQYWLDKVISTVVQSVLHFKDFFDEIEYVTKKSVMIISMHFNCLRWNSKTSALISIMNMGHFFLIYPQKVLLGSMPRCCVGNLHTTWECLRIKSILFFWPSSWEALMTARKKQLLHSVVDWVPDPWLQPTKPWLYVGASTNRWNNSVFPFSHKLKKKKHT